MNCIRDVLFVPFVFFANIDNRGRSVLQLCGGIFRRNLGDALLRFSDELFKFSVFSHICNLPLRTAAATEKLLVAQSVDRVERGGFSGGIKSEKDSYCGADQK